MRALALLLCLLWGQAWATPYFFGATSAGTANGTSAANRWAMASPGWSTMKSGDTMTWDGPSCAAGSTTCRMNINSTSANYSAANPLVIDFNGATLDAQFGTTHVLYIKAAAGIRIKNLNIRQGSADGIRMDGSDGTIGLHDVTFYNVTSNQSKLCGFAIDGLAYNITIDHSAGMYNYDSATPGNSDGFCTHFANAGAGGSGIVIRDSEFAYNSDDGMDLFQTNNAITIQRVYSHHNGYLSTGGLSGGDGRGIAMGPGTGAHIVESSIITGNAQFGIHRRDNSAVITLRHNTINGNGLGIGGGRDVNFPNSIDLNFPTSQTRFTDSGVNSEYRAVSQPVSSLSVGATSYASGTVGALASNQYGYSAGYVYVKGNPGTATVTAVPTTQSTAYNNWSSNCGLNNGCNNSDTVTGLTTTGGNNWDSAITSPGFAGGSLPTNAAGYCLTSTSLLNSAATALGAFVVGYGNESFPLLPPIGARGLCRERAPAATRPSAATRH